VNVDDEIRIGHCRIQATCRGSAAIGNSRVRDQHPAGRREFPAAQFLQQSPLARADRPDQALFRQQVRDQNDDALDLSEFENVEVSPGEITIIPLGISHSGGEAVRVGFSILDNL
jgi:hypothetical protein